MSYSPNYVASYEDDSGINTYYEPFLIPEKAFPVLEDAYCWRGKIKKRRGVKQIGRLRRVYTAFTLTQDTGAGGAFVDIMDLLNDPFIDVRSPPAPAISELNAEIEAGSVSITVGGVTFSDDGLGTLVGLPLGNSGTINYVTGAISLNFVPNIGAAVPIVVTFAYYPSLPVLGLPTKEIPQNIDNDQLIAFDQKYAYTYTGTHFIELASTAPTTWQTPNYRQFYSANYWFLNGAEYFWTTNFNVSSGAFGDPIRYYIAGTWTDFTPTITAVPATTLYTCLILVPYKNRLIALNTWEGTTAGGITTSVNITNRARWSWIGDPTDINNAWLNTPGHGGYIDAPTTEGIVGCHLIKDVLVVKFERSSWKLVYTGNNQLPFVWQRIDAELGAESTFSIVPFDSGVFAIGNYGITTDDTVSVQRIDIQIPQQAFKINTQQNGPLRVSGVRDYINELVYWAYPDATSNQKIADLIYPNKVLVYNYINKTYALFNDSFTCFGYFQPPTGPTWSDTLTTWRAYALSWNSINRQALLPVVAAGNQDGFVVQLNQAVVTNDPTLPIFAMNTGVTPVQLTVINHNLKSGSSIKITGIIGAGPNALNNGTYYVNYIDANTISLSQYNGTIFVSVPATGGTYLGGGQIAIAQNFNIYTKVFCPTYTNASQCRLGYMDFYIDQTPNGQVTLDVFADENQFIPMNDPVSNPSMLGDNTLLTMAENNNLPIVEYQQYQAKIWHRMFINSVCQNFQLYFFMDDAQMADETIYSNDFVMHAMVFYVSPNARLTQ